MDVLCRQALAGPCRSDSLIGGPYVGGPAGEQPDHANSRPRGGPPPRWTSRPMPAADPYSFGRTTGQAEDAPAFGDVARLPGCSSARSPTTREPRTRPDALAGRAAYTHVRVPGVPCQRGIRSGRSAVPGAPQSSRPRWTRADTGCGVSDGAAGQRRNERVSVASLPRMILVLDVLDVLDVPDGRVRAVA